MTTGEAVASVGYLYSRPIVVTIPAHVRGAVVAHTAGYAYDYFSESSASSSSSYQQNGGAGGNKKTYPLDGLGLTRRQFNRIEKGAFNPCVEGYVPRKVRGKLMCVPRSS
mgnify:CR=1 FL=1